MKIKKGLPPGMIFIDERLYEVVVKLQHLRESDIRELDAFLEYLLNGPEKAPSQRTKETARMYDFMNGGLDDGKLEQGK
jgi:hypothetical protein